MVAVLYTLGWAFGIIAVIHYLVKMDDVVYYSLALLSTICWLFVDAAHRNVIGVVIWILFSYFMWTRIWKAYDEQSQSGG